MQIHNAIITGSFSYNGADLSNVTSSNAYSASLSSRTTDLESTSSVLVGASSSFSSILTSVSSSQQQLSSSFLTLTASYTALSSSYTSLSASYDTFSGSASTRITVDSASLLQVSSSQQQISASLLNVISIFATTGSNSFRANQSITGSLVVSSTITAQTLIVQTVTSSIVYSSGSNIFGCDLNSRQTFTGSVLITGSLTIAGASSATSYSGTTIFGSTIACSPIGCFATSCATSFIGGTMSGTSATFSDQLIASSTSGGTAAIFRNTGAQNSNGFELRGGTTGTTVNWKFEKDNTVSNSFQLTPSTTNGGTTYTTPALTIASTGATTFSNVVKIDQATSSAAAHFTVNAPSNTSDLGLRIEVASSMKWFIGMPNNIVNDNFSIFYGPSSADRLTIDTSGLVGIGTTTPNTLLEIGATTLTGAEYSAFTTNQSGGTSSKYSFWRTYSGGSSAAFRAAYMANYNEDDAYNSNNKQHLVFATKSGTAEPVERMRIASNGAVTITGSIASEVLLNVQNSSSTGNGLVIGAGSTSSHFVLKVENYNGTLDLFQVKGDGTVRINQLTSNGTVATQSSNGTLYVSSDANLKIEDGYIENGLEKVLALKPRYFYWKDKEAFSADRQLGFYAQEVNAISEETANTPAEGYGWGIYDRGLVALLTKAIQEQQCTICSQASMINQLKTCLGIN